MSERNKILAAMANLNTFTVKDLAIASCTNEATVRTVMRRFDSTKIESFTSEGPKVPGGQVKTYRLTPQGRQEIKCELRELISKLSSYNKFREAEVRDRELGFDPLTVAIEGLNKVNASHARGERHVHLRVAQIVKDLDRAKIQARRSQNSESQVISKIDELVKKALETKLQLVTRETYRKILDRTKPALQIKSAGQPVPSKALRVIYSKHSVANRVGFHEKPVDVGSVFYSNTSDVVSTPAARYWQILDSSTKAFSLKLNSTSSNYLTSEWLANPNRHDLIEFKDRMRTVCTALEHFKSSCQEVNIPKIYVCSAMHDKFSMSLATHIQGRFDAFLDAAHATKRVNPQTVESGSLSGIDGRVVVIVTLNSSGRENELKKAILQIKKIQSQAGYGVVVADQAENFERLLEANIPRSNYLPKARDTGLEGIMQIIPD